MATAASTGSAFTVSGVGDVNADGFEDYVYGTPASQFGAAITFDGVDDYGTITASNLGSAASISLWFYPTAAGGTLFSIDAASAKLSSANQIRVQNGTTVRFDYSLLNRWNHLYYDGQTGDIAVNGVSLDGDNINSQSTTLTIGALLSGGVRQDFFAGQIAGLELRGRRFQEVDAPSPNLQLPDSGRGASALAVYQPSPSAGTVAVPNAVSSIPSAYTGGLPTALALSGGATQATAFAPAGRLYHELGAAAYWSFDQGSGNPREEIREFNTELSGTWPTTGRVSGGANFDGNRKITVTVATAPTADAVSPPVAGESYTIAAWINPRKIPAVGETGGRIVQWGQTSSNNRTNMLILERSEIRSVHWSNDLGIPFGSDRLNRWSHVAVTYDGTVRRIYVDGVERISDTPPAPDVEGTLSLRVGEFYDGAMDETAIFRHALTPGEIQRLAAATSSTFTNDASVDSYLVLSGTTPVRIPLRGAIERGMTGFAASGIGDVNGDGRRDFAIGAPRANNGALARAGVVYVVYGRTDLATAGSIDLTTLSGSNGVRILGAHSNEALGFSLSGAGDTNGDGIDDLVIGAPGSPVNGIAQGAAYLVYGAAGGLAPEGTMSASLVGGALDKGLRGTRLGIFAEANTASNVGYQVGYSVTGVGDTNGDGYDDIVVSVPNRFRSRDGQTIFAGSSGQAFLIYGASLTQEGTRNVGIGVDGKLNLAAMSDQGRLYGISYSGDQNTRTIGLGVRGLGDVDGDTYNDFAIQAPNGFKSYFLAYGEPFAPDDGDFYNTFADTSAGNEWLGRGAFVTLGSADAGKPAGLGDTDGDGFFETGLSLPWAKFSSSTQTVVSAGTSSPLLSVLHQVKGGTGRLPEDGSSTQRVQATRGSSGMGFSLSTAGDVNGDGLTDYVAGTLTGAPVVTASKGSSAGVYRSYSRPGFGQLLGELQTWTEVPIRPVGVIGDGRHSIPASNIALGFTGGGQAGANRKSLETIRVFRSAPPKPYIADEGGPNQRTFKSPALYWQLDTDRRRFSESTIIFHLPGAFLNSLTEAERARVGVFYTRVDPQSASAKASDWIPLPGSITEAGGRLRLERQHDSAAGFPSPSEVDFDGYYALFVGEATYNLGTEIRPPAIVDLGKLPGTGPLVAPAGATWWHVGQRKLYAIRPNTATVVRWIDDTDPGKRTQADQLCSLVWPGDSNSFSASSKQHFDYYIAGAPEAQLAVPGTGNAAIVNATLTASETDADGNSVSAEKKFFATSAGRSLLLLSTGDPRNDEIYFAFLWTIPFDNAERHNGTATVGTNLSEAGVKGGFHDATFGSPWFRNKTGFICVDSGYYNPPAFRASGPIIPVNLDLTAGDPSDNFDLVYFKKAARLKNARTQTLDTSFDLFLPNKSARYTVSWPTTPPNINIASGNGTGPLSAATYVTPSLYVQNVDLIDPDGRPNSGDEVRPFGFNPNDEHAVQLNVGGLPSFFPLRNDLGSAATSQPYVVVKYLTNDTNRTPSIAVWEVDAAVSFDYRSTPFTAGQLITAPKPLNDVIFPPAPATPGQTDGSYTENPLNVWTDRDGRQWAISAGSTEGGTTDVVMRYYYIPRPDFYLPATFQTALTNAGLSVDEGARIPWLSNWKSATTSVIRQPAAVNLRLKWPNRNQVPTLFYAETLVRPKRGLPAIEGQGSVEILASMASGSVKLIDPTQERSITLSASQKADVEKLKLAASGGGRREFEDLAPHLRRRLLYDPAQSKLIWRGEYIPFVTGEDMLLPNVMTARERLQATGIGTPATTTWAPSVQSLATATSALINITSSETPFDSLALTAAGAQNPGFVTLGFNNKEDVAGAVSVEVIYVDDELWKGDAKVIYPECPFVEQVSLRHNGDFAGATDSYDFDWYYMQSATYFSLRTQLGVEPYPPTDGRWGVGTVPPNPWTRLLPAAADRQGAVDVVVDAKTVGNDGVLGDLIWSVRYSSRIPGQALTSAYADVDLTEGWVKRVVGDFGPLRQRATGGGIQGAEDAFQDFSDRSVNTIVSMIAQIGRRWEGNVPLTCNNVDGLGLIEVYQTVLNRAKALSINAAPPSVASDTVVDTLLLAASRLADMYALLGNEAFADATDPTLVFTTGGSGIALNSSIHPFMNQVPTVLEEELALLRGRDNQRLPSVRVQPFYNRLVWNFTTDASGGDVAYALNYAIDDQSGDGIVDEVDAAKLFPQSHGDAWGHLLSGMKGYYQLIRSPEFIWVPRQEAVLVGGTPVEVDFYDERKFAALAATKSRVGREIVNLTYRSSYTENPALQWQGYKDADTGRAWGVSEWGSRAAIGARLDWIVGNALLPADDGTTDERDITKINRRTVAELGEVASNFSAIQEELDSADAGMNPLGIARDAVPFDINPASLEANSDVDPSTHFEQVYTRAVAAMANANEVFQYAQGASIALREQADSVSEFGGAVDDAEFDFETRLIEFFGTPYPDDIGPTGSYASGYNGPDLIHYMYLDRNQLGESLNGVPSKSATVSVLTGPELAKLESGETFDWSNGTSNPGVGSEAAKTRSVTYHYAEGFGTVAPAEWTTPRRVAGQLQLANMAVVSAMNELRAKIDGYSVFLDEYRTELRLFETRYKIRAQEIKITTDTNEELDNLAAGILTAGISERGFTDLRDMVDLSLDAAGDAAPKAVGLATDVGAGVRGVLSSVRAVNYTLFTSLAGVAAHTAAGLEFRQGVVERNAGLRLQVTGANLEIQEALAGLRSKYLEESGHRLEIAQLAFQVQQASAEYSAVLGSAERLIEERARFRRGAAASTQDFRHKDMAFRIFRNDAIQKYRAQFDLAARMVYLAAKAYDYETNLLGTDSNSGQAFLSQIVRARSIGRLGAEGAPLVATASGDPGLADGMARMKLNWDLVIKSQLGFNNPQTEGSRFSLREELFRASSEATWQEALARPYGNGNASGVVRNVLELPAFRRYAVPFAGSTLAQEPAIVIRFGTNVNFGQNFFVSLDSGNLSGPRLLGGGDSAYSSASFATKIRGSGIWFANYNNLSGSGMSNTPILYLFPTGTDMLRSPTGDRTKVRSFKILDQAIPIPFPLSGSSLASAQWSPTLNSLSDSFITIRRFAPFRAYHDSGDPEAGFDPEELNVTSRLIGRSVWNSEWYLIIPAGTLHSDRYEGLHRFLYGQRLDPQPPAGTTPAVGKQIVRLDNGATEWRDGKGVSDILLYFQTYAYEGI
jgi:hypothetical protein